jgi:hypothetical protein
MGCVGVRSLMSDSRSVSIMQRINAFRSVRIKRMSVVFNSRLIKEKTLHIKEGISFQENSLGLL